MSALASGQWTLGVLVGLPFAILGALILLAGVVLFVVLAVGSREDSSEIVPWSPRTSRILAAAGIFVLLLGYLAGIGWGYWPWQAAYHQYRTVTGTVATVSSRIVGGDRSVNQKFVITLTSGPQQYGVNDTRAALLHPGDPVALRCIRVYSYGSNNAGYDCQWGQS